MPRTKGSKNKPKTTTADFASQIAEKQSAKDAFCGAQRIPMHFRADAMHNITDALKYLSFRINSWAGSLQYSALWPSLGSH